MAKRNVQSVENDEYRKFIKEKKQTINSILGHKPYRKNKNKSQKIYKDIIDENEVIFCSGPAGTGKSYISLVKAIELLMDPDNNYIRISLFRAPVEAGDNPLGFLPGDLNEKLFPYIEHVYDLIGKLYGDEKKNAFIKAGFIKPRSIGHSRGNNLDNEIVLVEEAQNLTIGEMKLLLTRIGSDCKMILSGDVEQTDTRIKKGTESGLSHCMERLVDIKGIGMHSFTRDEIVRNPIIGKILENLD